MYFVGWQVAALVLLLLGGGVFLLWRYAAWRRLAKLITTIAITAVTLTVLAASISAPPRYELAALPAAPPQLTASEPAPTDAVPTDAAPTEPAPLQSDATPTSEPPPANAPESPAAPESQPPQATEPEAQHSASHGGEDTQSPAPQPSETADEVVYVLNTSTKKFHYPTCSDAGRIKDSNRSEAANRAKIIENGYSPCKRCNP